MRNIKKILSLRLAKLKNIFTALKDYKELIDKMVLQKNVFSESVFSSLSAQEKAIFDAYLKRFSSIQDYLGARIFPLLLEIAGISASKFTDVLYYIEKEEIVDNLEVWVKLRQTRKELEHDYPEKLGETLENLKFCIESYSIIELYYNNSLEFAQKYINATI